MKVLNRGVFLKFILVALGAVVCTEGQSIIYGVLVRSSVNISVNAVKGLLDHARSLGGPDQKCVKFERSQAGKGTVDAIFGKFLLCNNLVQNEISPKFIKSITKTSLVFFWADKEGFKYTCTEMPYIAGDIIYETQVSEIVLAHRIVETDLLIPDSSLDDIHEEFTFCTAEYN